MSLLQPPRVPDRGRPPARAVLAVLVLAAVLAVGTACGVLAGPRVGRDLRPLRATAPVARRPGTPGTRPTRRPGRAGVGPWRAGRRRWDGCPTASVRTTTSTRVSPGSTRRCSRRCAGRRAAAEDDGVDIDGDQRVALGRLPGAAPGGRRVDVRVAEGGRALGRHPRDLAPRVRRRGRPRAVAGHDLAGAARCRLRALPGLRQRALALRAAAPRPPRRGVPSGTPTPRTTRGCSAEPNARRRVAGVPRDARHHGPRGLPRLPDLAARGPGGPARRRASCLSATVGDPVRLGGTGAALGRVGAGRRVRAVERVDAGGHGVAPDRGPARRADPARPAVGAVPGQPQPALPRARSRSTSGSRSSPSPSGRSSSSPSGSSRCGGARSGRRSTTSSATFGAEYDDYRSRVRRWL